jgi:hypothetical protein
VLDIVAVVALKVADVAAAATVTEAGTVRLEFVFVRATTAPPVGAAPVSVTVQVALAELLNVAGTQDREVTEGNPPPVTIPPIPEVRITFPEADDASAPPSPSAVVLTPAAIFKFTIPTVPFAIVAAFIPDATHE